MARAKSLREYQADLKRFAKAIDVSYDTAFRRIVFEAYTRIIMRSPVDTGRFRASWTIQETTPNEATKPEGKYGPPPTPQLTFKTPYTIVWINNSLPYAEPLEFGHSKQAPQGMVRLTVAELETFINRVGALGT